MSCCRLGTLIVMSSWQHLVILSSSSRQQSSLCCLILVLLSSWQWTLIVALSRCRVVILLSSCHPLGSNLHCVVLLWSWQRTLIIASSGHPLGSNLCCVISLSTQQQTLLVLGVARCPTLSMHTHHWKVWLTTQNHDTVQHSGLNITKKTRNQTMSPLEKSL